MEQQGRTPTYSAYFYPQHPRSWTENIGFACSTLFQKIIIEGLNCGGGGGGAWGSNLYHPMSEISGTFSLRHATIKHFYKISEIAFFLPFAEAGS